MFIFFFIIVYTNLYGNYIIVDYILNNNIKWIQSNLLPLTP